MRKNFTLIEIIVTMLVVIILASFGMTGYHQILDDSRQKVCENNLQALEGAVEAYAYETGIIPATLGMLELRHLEKGYAAVSGRDRSDRFSRVFVLAHAAACAYVSDLAGGRKVFAAPFLTYDTFKKFGLKQSMFVCPADSNGPPSYAINGNLKDKKWSEIGDDVIIVGECDNADSVFTSPAELSYRHVSDFSANELTQTVTKNKSIKKDKKANSKKLRWYRWDWWKR